MSCSSEWRLHDAFRNNWVRSEELIVNPSHIRYCRSRCVIQARIRWIWPGRRQTGRHLDWPFIGCMNGDIGNHIIGGDFRLCPWQRYGSALLDKVWPPGLIHLPEYQLEIPAAYFKLHVVCVQGFEVFLSIKRQRSDVRLFFFRGIRRHAAPLFAIPLLASTLI